MNMFCYQCQEAMGNRGCSKVGACGKSPEVANLQDLLIWNIKGLSQITTALRKEKKEISKEINHLVTHSLFTTITNANFDSKDVAKKILKVLDAKEELIRDVEDESLLGPEAKWIERDIDAMVEKSQNVGVLDTEDEDVRSLRELITYGIKGLSAYTSHANVLLKENPDIDRFIQDTLAKITTELSVEELVQLVLDTGSYGVKAMALLDEANTTSYGNPEMSEVNIGVRDNPAILVSGHDLRDLEMLLEQTKGTGVDVYTHSEMLPANYYPLFKKYDNLVGNYGNAWHRQNVEFESFNGPILMTTNCIVPVKDSYRDRIFTSGAVAYPGLKHIPGKIGEEKDFSEIIDLAKKCEPPTEIESGTILGGFAHDQVFKLADKVVEAVKSGDIKEFVVMAGCDGRHKSRDYYSEFAKQLPNDRVILTAGCAKYRYNKLNLGDIGGIPRVLDAGQCNDSYSLALIAMKLQEVFELEDINDLPIVYNIAWYEQKAVIVLLALLSLGVKNIHLGPTLPAFLSENVVNVLVENFNIAGITTVEEDIERMLA